MKDKRNILIIALTVLLMGVGLPAVSLAADVSAECAYTDTDNTFICEIYVDTGGVELRSGGVMMTYDTAKLSAPVATKNEADWYFGSPPPANFAYNGPYIDTSLGQIIFIVGILDENNVAAGLAGTRVKVGDVSFTRLDSVNPGTGTPGAAQAGFFGITTDLGRVDPYVNFVDTAGAELDSAPVGFSEIVAERGDANADGNINAGDFRAVLVSSTLPDPPVYADCNGDGSVNAGDFRCILLK